MTLEMRGICKSFGSNDVLKHVDFSIQGGEICALLGENGAGKSTLMNILGGVLPADRGEIVIDGTPVHFRTPSDSLSAGVAFIHQELSLINDLAIYENMFIGRELKTKYGLLDAKTMIQKTQEVFDRLELHLGPPHHGAGAGCVLQTDCGNFTRHDDGGLPDYHGRAHHLPDRPGD